MRNSVWIRIGAPLAVFLLVLSAGTALAEDVVAVAPESNSVVFENEEVRLIDVHLKPGGKMAMHSHPDHLVYSLGPAKARLVTPDGNTQDLEITAGQALWSGTTEHTTENIGDTEMRLLNFELKK